MKLSQFVFYAEYSDTLDLFFSDILLTLRQSGIPVHTVIQHKLSLFDTIHNKIASTPNPLLSRFLRLPTAFCHSCQAARSLPKAIHVYVLPVHILLSPFVFLLVRHRYVIVCQGQLEGEGCLKAFIYRFFLSLAVRFSLTSFSCNIFETFRWHTWPYYYLSKFMTPLPWYGLTLTRSKQVQFSEILSDPLLEPSRPLTFGYLGRINKAKGCHELIEFFLQPQNRHYRLLLAGVVESSFDSRLIVVASSSLNISLSSSIPFPAIHKWFASIDVFISFSSGESIGAATVEALLAGKPVISMINSGSCQVLRHCVDSYILKSTRQADVQKAIDYVQLNYKDMAKSALQLHGIHLPKENFLAQALIDLVGSD